MASSPRTRRNLLRRRFWCRAAVGCVVAAIILSLVDIRSPVAQPGALVSFPPRPGAKSKGQPGVGLGRPASPNEQMLVRANEIHYDYANERVSAVGNVQIYYSGTRLEGDRVIYDQKTKRVHAEGNVRLTEPDGRVTYGEIINLSDDFRDGFVDSLRLETPDQTRMAASRADRSAGNFTVLHSGVYTACEPCADDPRKPPKWQVTAVRIVHDQAAQMMYFEQARLEVWGVPLVYIPYFSAPDPTAKRKSGLLIPTYHTNSRYGFAVTVPYYWALAPNYDVTFAPMITTRQGPLLQGEWRHRLVNGAYSIRASGIFQLDKAAFGTSPGNRDFRGHLQSAGNFALSDKWSWGWDGTVITDKTYLQDYGIFRNVQSTNLLRSTPDYVLSQAYLQGRGARSFFDMRAMYFYGFTTADNQNQSPIIHPVVNHDYTFNRPVFGGEVSIRSNLTSLSRDSANFDPVTTLAASTGLCAPATADPAAKTPANCVLRGVPGSYTRASSEAHWRRTIVDSYGQVFTPFISVRSDVAALDITGSPGVSNFIATGQSQVARFMPAAGVEYRYPFINVQSWGTQTIEPVAQLVLRPDETDIGILPNEGSQSLIFDASNLFRVNKFAGWDRVEGGGRLNTGMQYTAHFNQGGSVNVLFGQSYHLFGLNSYTVGGNANTGIGSGLDKTQSDYVARATYRPNAQFALTSRFRFNESDFTLERSEYEATVNFGRWSTAVMYGNYAAQPALGLLTRREGITATARVKVSPNWLTFGGVRYDLLASQINETQIGVGYVDDCLIVAMNYITQFSYSSTQQYNHTVLLQVSLRTLGGTSTSQGASALSGGIPGVTR
jgi:LPS-assembly protein